MIQQWEGDVRYSWRDKLLSLRWKTSMNSAVLLLDKLIYLNDGCLLWLHVCLRYTSGDVRLWDTLHWDSPASFLKPNSLTANSDPRPYVSHVQVNSTVAAAAYEDGECVYVCLFSVFLCTGVCHCQGFRYQLFNCLGERLCGPVEHRDRWWANLPLPKSREDPGPCSQPWQPRSWLHHWAWHPACMCRRSRLLEDTLPLSATQDCKLGTLIPHVHDMLLTCYLILCPSHILLLCISSANLILWHFVFWQESVLVLKRCSDSSFRWSDLKEKPTMFKKRL